MKQTIIHLLSHVCFGRIAAFAVAFCMMAPVALKAEDVYGNVWLWMRGMGVDAEVEDVLFLQPPPFGDVRQLAHRRLVLVGVGLDDQRAVLAVGKGDGAHLQLIVDAAVSAAHEAAQTVEKLDGGRDVPDRRAAV